VGAAVSSLHLVSAAPSSSRSSPTPAWGPSHGRQSSTNCPSVGPVHGLQSCRKGLLQCGGPPALPAKLLQHGLLSHHGPTGPARSLLQRGLSMGSQPALGIHLLRHGVLHGLQVEICSTMDLHRLQWDSLPHHGVHHGLQGNLCSSTWGISSLAFFTDLGVCRAVSLLYSLLSPAANCPYVGFFPLLKYVIPEALPPSLVGAALASSRFVLEPAGIASVGHRRSF